MIVGESPTIACQKPDPSSITEKKKSEGDFDLFGSDDDEESEEAKRVREERLAAYAAKKAKKPGPIAKSSIIFDVKPVSPFEL